MQILEESYDIKLLISLFFISESPVSVKMRIRHYFSHLALNNSASYDVRQGFDKQFDLIEVMIL